MRGILVYLASFVGFSNVLATVITLNLYWNHHQNRPIPF